MRIPEPIFVLVNAVVRTLLKSPIHTLMSDNILLINYAGRKSGKKYSTPVRYARNGDRISCLTSSQVQWWRNLTVNPEVTLLVRGEIGSYRARVLERDPEKNSTIAGRVSCAISTRCGLSRYPLELGWQPEQR